MTSKIKMKEYLQRMWTTRESTSSTDRLLTSNASGLSDKTSLSSHVLHSLPPKRSQRPYQATTVPKHSQHKYDKVPTKEVHAYTGYDRRKSNQVPIAFNIASVFKQETMAESKRHLHHNMTQCFTAEKPIKPDKDKDLEPELDLGNTTVQVPDHETGGKSSVGPQVLAAISVSMGSLVVGFVSGYSGPAEVSLTDPKAQYFPVSDEEKSWVGSVMPLAALLGGMIGGPLIDYLGRKRTILATTLPFIISFVFIACAVNVPLILVGRAIAGVCVGILSLSLPVYLGETVQPEVRGTLGLLPTALGNTGILVCYTAGMYTNWWQLAIVGAVIPIPFLILMFVIPETPMWQYSKGDAEKARSALQWLRGSSADVSSEFQEIERTAIENKKVKNGTMISDLLAPSCAKPLLILIALMFFQQFSGINAVIFYAPRIFKDAGSTIDKSVCSIIVGVVNFFSTFFATALIDRAGRKVLLYVSDLLMVVTLIALGTFLYVKTTLKVDVDDYGWVPLAAIVIFVIGFSLGFGPIPWLMMGELLPANVRGSAASISTAFNWSCTFIVTKTFSDIQKGIGEGGVFWLFGSICFVALFFVIFFVPETRGKSLEDIEKKFAPPRRRMSIIANLRPTPLSV